jgi:hypothetical protein
MVQELEQKSLTQNNSVIHSSQDINSQRTSATFDLNFIFGDFRNATNDITLHEWTLS